MEAKGDTSANSSTNRDFAHSGSGADSVAPPLDSSASQVPLAGGDAAPARSFTHDHAPDERMNSSDHQQSTLNIPSATSSQKLQPPRAAKAAHLFVASKSLGPTTKSAPAPAATSKSLMKSASTSQATPPTPAGRVIATADSQTRNAGKTPTPRISPLAQAALHSGSPQTIAALQTLGALTTRSPFPIFSMRQPAIPENSENSPGNPPPIVPIASPRSMNVRPSSSSSLAAAPSPAQLHQQPQTPPLLRHSNHSDPGADRPARLADHRSDPEPLHTSAAARLQHDIAQAVAISATMYPEPVGQPVSFSRNPAQLTYWKELFSELSGRRSSLTPAQELHLHLVTELLCLHQESVERGRVLDRAHMQKAAEIIDAITPGTHASRPIVVPSQSPALHSASQRNSVARQPTSAPPASQHTQRVTQHTQRVTDRMAHTWLAPAQQAGIDAERAKHEQQRQDRQLYRHQQALLAEDAQDVAILKAAEHRIKQRQEALQRLQAGVPNAPVQLSAPLQSTASAPADAAHAPRKLSIRVRAPAVSRTQELRLAALTGDDELLRHGSDRVKSEERSEDEEGDVLKELAPKVAASHLFFPKKAVKFTDNGYVLNSFVLPANAEEEMPSERSVSRSSSYPSDTDTSHYTDDDPSGDYLPSPHGSASPSTRRSISASEWEQFQAFKQAQQTHPGGRQQPTGPPTYNISIAEPPEHGDWRDINHLTTVFKDKHVKYVNRCGQGQSLSVWECYTETARQCIMEHLTAISTDPSADFSVGYMTGLTDDELYALLQDQLGISYDVEAETALRAITFQGSILEVSNWVVFRTAWSQVLQRVTPAGTIQPRRLAELFRNSVPDDFMRSWLNARKHLTWTEAYTAVLGALKDSKWHTHYSKHLIATAAAVTRTPADPKFKQNGSQQQQQPLKPPVTKEVTPAAPAASTTATQPRDKTPFDPLKFRTRKGGFNVNPNLKGSDYWENADKTLCSRCDLLHRWLPDACTADKNAAGEKIDPPLTAQEFAIRLKKRWDRGFFFSKQIADYKSPSAQDSAQKAASATSKLQQNSNKA
jgi:hypothetical protein